MRKHLDLERADVSDLDAICALLFWQFDEHDIDISAAMLRRAVSPVLEDERLGVIFVAREDDRVVGIAAVSFAWTLEHGGKSAWLDELYVLPRCRGRGIGTALLEKVVDEACALGCAAIDLEVDQGHLEAERLYARAGFQPLPRSRWVRPVDPGGESCAS